MVHAVRNHAMLPGPPVTWASDWVSLPPSVITAEDVGAWPYSVGVLVKWVTFLGTLHWPAAGADMGLVEFPILRCFSCMSLGLARGLSWRKLFLSIGDQVAQFQCRLFLLVQAFIFGDHVVHSVEVIMRSAWWYSDRSLGVHGSLQLLNSSHVRERDKALVASWLVVSGTFFSWEGWNVPC